MPSCRADDHARAARLSPAASLDRAAQLFRAMGDAGRLRLLDLLRGRELCVTEIVAAVGDKFSTVSQRLGILHRDGLLVRRRDGNHLHYSLADRHVADLVSNALDHARELDAGPPETLAMSTHADHAHQHGPDCGHTPVVHDGHTDYLHDGHLHHQDGGVVEEHTLAVTAANPTACTPDHDCGAHPADHVHGPGCGHEAVPHGDHVDYLVDGHLHHPHAGHCDDHGELQTA